MQLMRHSMGVRGYLDTPLNKFSPSLIFKRIYKCWIPACIPNHQKHPLFFSFLSFSSLHSPLTTRIKLHLFIDRFFLEIKRTPPFCKKMPGESHAIENLGKHVWDKHQRREYTTADFIHSSLPSPCLSIAATPDSRISPLEPCWHTHERAPHRCTILAGMDGHHRAIATPVIQESH